MPPVPPEPAKPRLIVYYQTHHDEADRPISVLPLLTTAGVRVTHVHLAAIHLNEDPAPVTLNDLPPAHPKFQTLWAEMRVLQASGVRVVGMLGGAARGSFERLDGDDHARFERHYRLLRDVVREHALDGLDLDVEEHMSLAGVVRLIDRLRADFGPSFTISLAPVATALLGDDDPRLNLSGFGYCALQALRGREIAYYNTQFYCGWGDCSNPAMYESIMARGWPPEKVVVGLVTNPANGRGWVPWEALANVLPVLVGRWPRFGGVMGWEYFNSLPGGKERPWEWARVMTALLGGGGSGGDANNATVQSGTAQTPDPKSVEQKRRPIAADDIDGDEDAAEAPLPKDFEYHSDTPQDD